jgi:hypothetical protein
LCAKKCRVPERAEGSRVGPLYEESQAIDKPNAILERFRIRRVHLRPQEHLLEKAVQELQDLSRRWICFVHRNAWAGPLGVPLAIRRVKNE